MNTHPHFLPRALACAALCALAPILAGCSGVVSNLNSAQVTVPNVSVANPFGLDKQAVVVAVANAARPALRPHAAGPHAGPNVNTFSFPNQSPVGLAAVKSAQLSFALVPRVTADGTGLPAHFTLSALTMDGVVSDADGKGNGGSVVLTQLTAGGPLSFTQQADGSSLGVIPGGDFNFQMKPQIDLGGLSTMNKITYAAEMHNINNINNVNGGKRSFHLGGARLDLATGTDPQQQVALGLTFGGR